MKIEKNHQQQRRPKRKKRGWKYLLVPRVLKSAFKVGILIYRFARFLVGFWE